MRTRLLGLALSAALASACGGGGSTPPPAPSPPAVSVLPHASPTIDTHFDVDVEVSGCDSVKGVTLSDGQTVLVQANNPLPRTTFTIPASQVNYKADGLAASLDLLATAECANGAKSTSPGAGQLFMPAQQVFSGTFAFSTLAIEPDGSGLVTCQSGAVVRLGTDGALKASTGSTLGFNCTASGYLLRASQSELYWLEPGAAVARLDGSLRVLSSYNFAAGSAYLPTDATTPAVIFSADGGQFLLLDRQTGVAVGPFDLAGVLDGVPGNSASGLYVPEQANDLSGGFIKLQVERINPSTGTAFGAPSVVATVNVDQLGLATVPVLNLSPDGDTAYFIAGDANTELWACASIGSAPCYDRGVGGQLVFKTTLPGGPYAIAQPLGNHLVVASAQQVLFTNPNGTPQGTATLPTGGLSVLNIVPGQGDQFYVLDGDRNGNLLEVVMLVGPGQEAARFHVDTGAIGVDYDQSYTPYLLVNGTLSKLLSPDQYWAARQ